MDFTEIVSSLAKRDQADAKLILLVLDGVGDIRHRDFDYRTPLEAARTPQFDRLAPLSALGRIIPVDYGITPGSGPAHLGLFGYDPRCIEIGRGVLETMGLGMDLRAGDAAARANVCTVKDGVVVDRRAGRPPTEETAKVCGLLQRKLGQIDDVQLIIQPGKGHRFAIIFRGKGLAGSVTDTDPHQDNLPVHQASPLGPEAQKTADIVNKFQQEALKILEGNDPFSGILLRGIAGRPDVPTMTQTYGVRCAAIATYPMYRGLARLVGMDLLETGQTTEDEFKTCADNWNDHDYFFIHIKGTDEAGEDGDFQRKVSVIEEVDAVLSALLDLAPEALAITGDHCTPCAMKLHSWHPVPLLLHAARAGGDGLPRFTEHDCVSGSLGTFLSMHLMTLMLASAGRLDKFGA